MKQIDTILQIRLGDEFFGIDSDSSNQILRVPVITSIPLANRWLRGIVVLNGKIVPVVDLKDILGIGSVDIAKQESRIITISFNGDEVAFLVDEVIDAFALQENNFEEIDSEEEGFAIGFYRHNDFLLQLIEPKNLINNEILESFTPLEVEKLSDEEKNSKSRVDVDTKRYLFFKSKDEYFAIDIELVAELIFVPREITPIPGGDRANLGTITLREEVIDVFDFNLLFGFESVDLKNDRSRILILKEENKKIAICVEYVEEIKDISVSDIEPINNSLGEEKIESLYKDSKSIVSIVSSLYLRNLIDKYCVVATKEDKIQEQKKGSENMRELVVFAIDKEEFAFDIESVQEIIIYQEVTPLPDSDEYIEGVINLRGAIIPVINLPKKLDFDLKINNKSKIIVCMIENEKVGFLVDDVNDILFIEDKFVALSKKSDSLIKSTISLDGGKRVILELRLDKIISVEDLLSIKEQ